MSTRHLLTKYGNAVKSSATHKEVVNTTGFHPSLASLNCFVYTANVFTALDQTRRLSSIPAPLMRKKGLTMTADWNKL
jgi:hypothetical protein